jgi:putative ABC transport system ATP-binding protein
MVIRFHCENSGCSGNLRVLDNAAGKRAECPFCGQVCIVPAVPNPVPVFAQTSGQDPSSLEAPGDVSGSRGITRTDTAQALGSRHRNQPNASLPIGRRVIELDGVSKIYRVGEETIRALNDVSLTIERGEYVALMGPSGSGKSTLMHILGCLDLPTSGRYCLEGDDVSRLPQSTLAAIRSRRIGFVFQAFELLPRATVLKNVILPLVYARARNRKQRSLEAIHRVGLTHRIHHRPNELSGGQRQRVAIARALAQEPTVLLADEPTGNLDSRTGRELLTLFGQLNREGQTIVIVTHDSAVAKHCRRVICLVDGEIISDESTPGSRDE